jgi:polar amino acid transport system substrate-binding protein
MPLVIFHYFSLQNLLRFRRKNLHLPKALWSVGLCLFLAPFSIAFAVQLITEHNPPAEYLDNEGNVSGVTVDLVKLLMQRLDEKGSFTIMPWSRGLLYAQSEPETILFETVKTPAREQLFQWVGPLKQYQIWLYSRSDRADSLLSSEQLSHKNIACSYRNSAINEDFRRLGFRENENFILTAKVGDCASMLSLGRVDLIAVSELMIDEIITQLAGDNIELKPIRQLSQRERYLAFSLDMSKQRVKRWQQALEQSYLDGSMRKLYQEQYSETIIERLETFAKMTKQ